MSSKANSEKAMHFFVSNGSHITIIIKTEKSLLCLEVIVYITVFKSGLITGIALFSPSKGTPLGTCNLKVIT